MNPEKMFEVLRITLPVFALMGIGNLLSRRRIMTESHQAFLNGLAYYLSLPALIFSELASQPFHELLNGVVIFSTLISISIIFVLYAAGAFIFKLRKSLAAVMIFGTYWANAAYIGFPLVSSAFGAERGLTLAAIVNAFSLPVFIAVAFVLLGFSRNDGQRSVIHSISNAVINPIVIAAFSGLLVSWFASALNLQSEKTSLPLIVQEAVASVNSFLKLVGTMGLPLALLSVGGKLHFRAFRENLIPLSFTIAGKLIFLPLTTFLVIKTLFPTADRTVTGVAVLLMATPVAVATSVVSSKFKVEEQFVSSLLAVSTVLSIITIPLWLYFIL
ncbi:MAG: AEC family transporter [Chitinispirillaceae bacterium]